MLSNSFLKLILSGMPPPKKRIREIAIASLEDAIKGKYKNTGFSVIYIVRRDETVIYVGQTMWGADSRLKQHLSTPPSLLGEAIKKAKCLDNWTVEIIPAGLKAERLQKEANLIKELNPLFNVTYNF